MAGHDENIKIWAIETGESLQVLRAGRPYKGMNITGATDLTKAQKSMLIELDRELTASNISH